MTALELLRRERSALAEFEVFAGTVAEYDAAIAEVEGMLSIVKRFVALPSGAWHPERHAAEEAELVTEARDVIAKATEEYPTPSGHDFGCEELPPGHPHGCTCRAAIAKARP